MDDIKKYIDADPELFAKVVEEARQLSDAHKANIMPYGVEDYKKMKTFLSPDQKSGYALKDLDELVSVFSKERGRGDDIVRSAVERGAKRLDAYDIGGKLPELYGRHGFKESKRLKFDPQYASDEVKDYLMKHKPDVVYMNRPDDDHTKRIFDEVRRQSEIKNSHPYTTFNEGRSPISRVEPDDFSSKKRVRELFNKARRQYEDIHGVGSRSLKSDIIKKLGKLGKYGGGIAAGLAGLISTSGDANAAIDELDFMGKLDSGDLPKEIQAEKEEYNKQERARRKALEMLKNKYPGLTD